MKRCSYILLSIIITVLFSSPLEAKENDLENTSEMSFVCTTDTAAPTLYVHTLGTTSLTPLISWHPEYLLPQQSGSKICQQVAKKLQSLYQQKGSRYITSETQEEHTLVCMVKVENGTCRSNYSEPLFSINPNYNAECILDRREPLECIAIGRRVRGVFSIPDSPYKPTWWLW